FGQVTETLQYVGLAKLGRLLRLLRTADSGRYRGIHKRWQIGISDRAQHSTLLIWIRSDMAVGERCAGLIHESSRVGGHVTSPLSPSGFRIASSAWSRCLRGSGEELHRRRLRRHTSGSRPAGPALRRSLPRVVYSGSSLTIPRR